MFQNHAASPPHTITCIGHFPAPTCSQKPFGDGGGTSKGQVTPSVEAVNRQLRDRHILVVEDEALVAMDLEHALRDAGSNVLGPAASLTYALELFAGADRVDGAILDVDLQGEPVFPLARNLASQSVPFVFHTGVGLKGQMEDFRHLARVCMKPAAIERVLGDLADLLALRNAS